MGNTGHDLWRLYETTARNAVCCRNSDVLDKPAKRDWHTSSSGFCTTQTVLKKAQLFANYYCIMFRIHGYTP